MMSFLKELRSFLPASTSVANRLSVHPKTPSAASWGQTSMCLQSGIVISGSPCRTRPSSSTTRAILTSTSALSPSDRGMTRALSPRLSGYPMNESPR